MDNPNNCETCDYKRMQTSGDDEDGWCYMFREEPTEVCMQHTARKVANIGSEQSFPLLAMAVAAVMNLPEFPGIEDD